MKNIIIAPSLLSADFSRLGADCDKMEKAGAEIFHFDVMDGEFVPNISFGIPVLQSINKYTSVPMDVHLMIDEPHRYIKQFADAGADYITIHAEAESDIEGTLRQIAELGVVPSISIKPNTPASEIYSYLPLVKMVLVMSVEPGFGGQSFMPSALDKIRDIKKKSEELGLDIDIEVDGGIGVETGKQVIDAGANVLVAGSALFKSDDPAEIINELKAYGKAK
ncbi:MAG: ribulose-phosphate 3-epimerase [Acutalibacteraceae bacterium]